jgi:glycosyltransferase involved in cell wall biosynthesis
VVAAAVCTNAYSEATSVGCGTEAAAAGRYNVKILYHHRTASRRGDAVHIEELVRALREAGHEVLVIGPRSHDVVPLGTGPGFVDWLKRQLPLALYELLELGYSVPAMVRLWRAYRRFRPDAVYERSSLFLLAGTWLKRLTGIPLLMELNAPLVEAREAHQGLSLRRLARWAEHAAWQSADVVLPVSGVLAAYAKKVGIPGARIQVIRNGVDLRRFDPAAHDSAQAKARLGLAGRRVLGFTGFLSPRHRLNRVIPLLADAAGAADEWHLLMVGDGPEVPDLKAMARELGVDHRVIVTGAVAREHIPSYVAAFDIALQPGASPFDSPLKLFEYMAMAKPIVAPDMPNIREILSVNHDAILFDPDCQDSFERSVSCLMKDKSLRAALGAQARHSIDALTWAGNAALVAELASKILKCQTPR